MRKIETGEIQAVVLRQIAFQRKHLNLLGAFHIPVGFGKVVEALNTAHHPAFPVMDGRNGNQHRHTAPSFGLTKDNHRASACRVSDHAPVQWAKFLAAQPVTILILMDEDIIHASVPHNLLRSPSGEALGGFAPVHNAARPVTDIEAVIQRVQDYVG